MHNRIITLLKYTFVAAVVFVTATMPAQARKLNDKILNRPYADNRAFHLGFSVGMHTQDVSFVSNGLVTEDGENWYIEQPAYEPGFCVNVLLDFRLNNYFNLRFNPGLYFGNRNITMLDQTFGYKETESLKSAFIVAPIDLKFSSVRYRNSRPYVSAGVMPAIDVAKKRGDIIRLKPFDTYLTVGVGCDFYLPYFKFIPELKFCFGLMDVLERNRPDLADDPTKLKFTDSIKKATSKMIVLTFYFE